MDHKCIYEGKWGSLDAFHNTVIEKLENIETQTTLTNGRVRKLEAFRLITTVGFCVFLLTTTFMLIAHEQGWVEAISEYGGK